MQMISLTWAGLTHFTDEKTKVTTTHQAGELRFKPSPRSHSSLRASEESLGCSFLVHGPYFHFYWPGKCQSAWHASHQRVLGALAESVDLLPGQGARRRGACAVPESQLSFCLCSVWGDPAGLNGKLFRAWVSKRLPFLFPLRLEDIRHSRGEGRCGATSGNDIAFVELDDAR